MFIYKKSVLYTKAEGRREKEEERERKRHKGEPVGQGPEEKGWKSKEEGGRGAEPIIPRENLCGDPVRSCV